MTLKLTDGELRVVDLLIEGYQNHEIAQVLGLKVRTVKAHLNRMFVRNGISEGEKRVKLAMIAFRDRHAGEALQPTAAKMTERELHVLKLISDGLANKDIAAVMRVTIGTLRMQLLMLFTKLGINTRLEAALWYESHIKRSNHCAVRPRRYAGGWKVY